MKKVYVLILALCLLAGCSGQKEMEPVMDSAVQPEKAAVKEMVFTLPDSAASEVIASDHNAQVIFCDGFILTKEIKDSGDLHKTFQETTGYPYEQLSVMETAQNEIKRYECVWTAVGENGDEIGRCAVLDDGSYHYILTVQSDAENAGALTEAMWNPLFSSFCLRMAEETVNSGS